MEDISLSTFITETECGKKWILIFKKIYDIQHFMKIHPGGAKIIASYIGKDASDAWMAMHPDKKYVNKFLKPIEVGNLINENTDTEMVEKFRQIRNFAQRSLLFDSSISFFMLQYFQILFFEICAWLNLYFFGVNVLSFLLTSLLITTAQPIMSKIMKQKLESESLKFNDNWYGKYFVAEYKFKAQAGWAQHDYGHLSVFNTRKLNKMMHQLIIGHIKGASSSWWNFRHNLHHAKPNIIKTDPDISVPYLFLLGSKIPVEWGRKRRGFMPYNYQHNYFFLFGPPILLPIYFHYENMYFILKRWKTKDLCLTISFFIKFFLMYGAFFDSWISVFGLYMTARFFESFWFTMATQMSHLPMEVDRDNNLNWATQQLRATRNVKSNWFNDWFTGHLNFQIEHHLFPDMPRHNYHIIKPVVQEYCKSFDLEYIEKPLKTAFGDIIRSLKNSGELWIEAYKNPG